MKLNSRIFSAFSFIGKWMTDRIELSIDQVGYVMFFLGVGNLEGSFGGAYVIQKFNRFNTLVAGFLLATWCFFVLPSDILTSQAETKKKLAS